MSAPTKANARRQPGDSSKAQATANAESLPQSTSPFATRHRFLILAAMAGWVQPERVTERILAELTDEVAR